MCNVDLEIHLVPYSSNLLYELLPSGQPKNDKHLFDSEEKKVDLEFSRTRRQWVGSHNQSYLERMVNAPWEWMNPEIISEFVWLHSASPQEYNDFNPSERICLLSKAKNMWSNWRPQSSPMLATQGGREQQAGVVLPLCNLRITYSNTTLVTFFTFAP